MTKPYDHYGLKGSQKPQDNLADDIANILQEAGEDRVKLMTLLTIYVEKRDARVWQNGFKVGREK